MKRSLRRTARSLIGAALASVEAETLFRRELRFKGSGLAIQGRSFDLARFRKIHLLALGKSAPEMAQQSLKLLGRKVAGGVVVFPAGRGVRLSGLECLPSSHPIPDSQSVRAARALLKAARRAGKDELVLVLLSGGGSSLACLPAEGIRLKDKQFVTKALMEAGADIRELNIVRKHLSNFKGGRLAEAAWPAAVLNVIVSDVVGNDPGVIASGPTHWDGSTFLQARRVLEKYGIWEDAPVGIRKAIEDGLAGRRQETLRRNHPVFRRMRTHILADIGTALRAAASRAQDLGFEARILDEADSGEARETAALYARLLETKLAERGRKRFRCFLAGGELTVTVRGSGRGGRNMEFCLAFLKEWRGRGGRWLALSLGTDGRDGPTDAAGAYVTPALIRRSERLGLDPDAYLRTNDSYGFFEKVGGLIRTGPTGVNVMDLRIFLFGPAGP